MKAYTRNTRFVFAGALCAFLFVALPAYAGKTLEAIKQRG
jgi:hypothetical protein